MSQYPYGYPSQGQPPQQQYPPYQPYNTYHTPNGYATQPPQQYSQPSQPSTPGSYYAASQSAYNHNASSIPGLGIPSTAPALAVPFNESWNQGYGASTPHAQQASYSLPASTSPSVPSSFKQNSQVGPLPGLAKKADNTWTAREPNGKELRNGTTNEHSIGKSNPPGSEEEGEISEPDFDDLYDDVPNQTTTAPQPAAKLARSTEDLAANNSDQEPDFYDTEVDQNDMSKRNALSTANVASQQMTELPEEAERERSRSYSPYLSPREVEQDSLVGTRDCISETQGTDKVSSETVDRVQNPKSSFGVNGAAEDQTIPPNRETNSEAAMNEAAVAANGSRTYANVPEAQNEAKKAILRLLPHGVKYQTYIDEGFDAKVVKELFSQLHLPTDPAVPITSEKAAANQEKDNPKPSTEAPPLSKADSMAKKQEERKDKIARLLAEKKAKAAVAASNTGSTPDLRSANTTISQSSTTPTKPLKTRAEMDRLLQQKMQALRQKAAQKSSAPTTPKPIVGDKPTTPTIIAASSSASVRPESAAGTPFSVNLEAAPVQETATHPPRDALEMPTAARPVLSSAPKGAQLINQRKRPVAADFMDYPPASIKRPSLANRQNSSLVISLSDDEDEDEDDDDVEMEVDSAEDSPAPAPQSIILPKRGPSIRDYPPLTNRNSPRHLASPAPGASPVGGNVDLQARERQIMELKRRIQEAEARAKNKPKKGSATPQTPSAGNITPTEQLVKPPTRRMLSSSDADEKGGPSAQLLQEAEAATTRQALERPNTEPAEGQRPPRVSSVQVPGKSDKVREKAERLRRMQEEMMKLQAEINEDMAEEEGPGDDIDTSIADMDADMGLVASPSMTQPAEALNDSHAPKPSDTTSEIHDVVQQHDNAVPTIPVETEAPDDQEENMDMSSSASDDEPTPLSPSLPPAPASSSLQFAEQEQIESGTEDQRDEAAGLTVYSSSSEPGAVDTNASDDYEPPEAELGDRPSTASPQFSSATADHTDSIASTQRQTNADLQKRLAELRDQLISAKASKEQMTLSHPIGAEETSREVHRVSSIPSDSILTPTKASDNVSSTSTTSFVPYESPLRYFRAYRFHPRYSDDVASGLKSLTYSSRIDPKKEMCPDELDGTECPRGDACQFQHFRSIVAPDNEIILDLGSSDDLIGDRKKDFNNGLRELVAAFQQSKVRDFGTIAQAIVEFRRRFLGDASKILRLEGVSI